MKEPSYIRTILAQVSLCFALYLALNIGQPKKYGFLEMGNESSSDFFFITVWGALRSVKEETLLLKQMEKITMISQAKFVLHIRELGENDRFMKNGTRYFSSLNVAWYSILASNGSDRSYVMKQIELQYGQTLDVIAIDSKLLQGSIGSGSEKVNNQLTWLKKVLQTSNSKWRIVVGFDPLVICEEDTQQLEVKQHLFEPIHQIFMEHGVNAYLSRGGCAGNIRMDNIAYIGADMASQTQRLASRGGKSFDRFLLHRVSSSQTIQILYLIDTAGEIVTTIELQQTKGRDIS